MIFTQVCTILLNRLRILLRPFTQIWTWTNLICNGPNQWRKEFGVTLCGSWVVVLHVCKPLSVCTSRRGEWREEVVSDRNCLCLNWPFAQVSTQRSRHACVFSSLYCRVITFCFWEHPHVVKFLGNRGPNLLNICAVMNIFVVSTIYIWITYKIHSFFVKIFLCLRVKKTKIQLHFWTWKLMSHLWENLPCPKFRACYIKYVKQCNSELDIYFCILIYNFLMWCQGVCIMNIDNLIFVDHLGCK